MASEVLLAIVVAGLLWSIAADIKRDHDRRHRHGSMMAEKARRLKEQESR